jgi:tripartite-type tricarboxylate transporter receptor subunit TctC
MKRLLALLILCAGVTSAGAQTYPAKPVKIIVPTAPGGGYDFIARLLSEKLSTDLGQGFIVENRTGAGLVVGSQAAATAAPDGYTLLIGGLANMAFSPALFKSIGYDPVTDFVPVALVGAFTYALVARKDLPQSSLKELVEFARKNPGKLTIAHAGTGSGQYVAAVMLKQLGKIDLLEVPYKGAQPAYTDLLAGRVDLFFDNTTTTRPFVADGRVKAIATSGTERDALLPNVPTGREAGLEGMVLDSWIGLFAPAKTPKPIVERLRAATLKAVEAPETKKRLETSGWRTLSMPAAETESFVRSEAQKWPKFLQQAGVKPE